MKQKPGRRAALLHKPSLLFLERAHGRLDPSRRRTLRDELGTARAARRRDGNSLTTHNLAEAERLCGRVAVIKQGRLLAVAIRTS